MKRWPQLRAGLIAIAIAFGLVDGCPVPPGAESIKRVVEWPVAWMRPVLRIAQQWAVYQSPGRDRYRMSIEGQGADGAWRILYRAADPQHDEDAAWIEHARVTEAWNPTDRVPIQYPEFASWITARMLANHADLVAARVRFEKIVIHPGGFDSTGQFVNTYVRRSKP